MTPIEIGLTVAVVVLAALQIVAWIDGCNHHIKLYRGQTDLAQLIRKVNETIGIVDDTVGICGKHVDAIGEEVIKQKREVSQVIKLFSASETKRQAKLDELQAALQELASKHLPVHASHDLLTVLERQIAEVRETVAGMLVSRVALKAFPFEEVNYRGLVDKFGYRPEAFADAAHAACPDPRWKSDCEPAVVADEDDQVTTLGEPTFMTVDERTEA